MPTVGKKMRRRDIGFSCAECDTCGARYSRRQLVRGRDGLLRCSGAGTLNDARGRIAMELDEMVASRSEQQAASTVPWDDPGAIDKANTVVP
jgi:hypothetical protein